MAPAHALEDPESRLLDVERQTDADRLVELLDHERRNRPVAVLRQNDEADCPRGVVETATDRELHRRGRHVTDDLLLLEEQDTGRAVGVSVTVDRATILALGPHALDEAVAGLGQLGLVQADGVAPLGHTRSQARTP